MTTTTTEVAAKLRLLADRLDWPDNAVKIVTDQLREIVADQLREAADDLDRRAAVERAVGRLSEPE